MTALKNFDLTEDECCKIVIVRPKITIFIITVYGNFPPFFYNSAVDGGCKIVLN